MSFSERMCSCCLVSTMCRFFRIFMAKVLFSSLLSWTCSRPGIKKGDSRLYRFFPFSFPAESINAGVTPRRPLPARRGQSLQPPECRWCWSRPGWGWRKRRSLLHTCHARKRGRMWEQDLQMTRRIKEEIIHFQHPETEHPSVLRSFVCRYYWIGLVVICQGCYYQGCGDFETFGFSPGKALSLSGSSQFVPVQTQNGPKAGPSSTVRPWWRRAVARTLTCPSPVSDARVFCFIIWSLSTARPLDQRGLGQICRQPALFWVTQNSLLLPRPPK